MTGAEVIAILGGLIWIGERILSWTHKKKLTKKVAKVAEIVENGNGKPPAFEK